MTVPRFFPLKDKDDFRVSYQMLATRAFCLSPLPVLRFVTPSFFRDDDEMSCGRARLRRFLSVRRPST